MKKLFLFVLLFASAAFSKADQFAATQGLTVTLIATADGTQPFAYVWKKDDVVIAGATASTYSITNVQPANQGVYQVIISNSAGSASAVLGLTVSPPVIVVPPPPKVIAPSNVKLAGSQK